MKQPETQPGTGARPDESTGGDLSRRQFLRSAAVAGVAAAAMPIAAMAQTERQPGHGRNRDSLEEILTRYGSELGELDQIV